MIATMNIILGVAGVLLLFFLAIIIHEFGHFIAAKLLGFRIDAFSIFFGPALWKRRSGGVEYRIGSIPLGGYVALPQLDPSGMAAIQGENGKPSEQLPPVSPWKRIIVAFAGPFGNIVLAIAAALAIYAFAPRSEFGGEKSTVGVVSGERAAASGIMTGDEIAAIGGQPVSYWSDVLVECHLAGSPENGLAVTVRRGGATLDITLPVAKDPSTGFLLPDGISPLLESEIVELMEGCPAKTAGLLKGDRVLAINGVRPTSPASASELVRDAGTNAVTLAVERTGAAQPIEITVTPEFNEEIGRPAIGVVFADPSASIPQWMAYRSPLAQISGDARLIFRMLRALFAPKTRGEQKRAAKGMGGPGTLLYILWNEVHSGFFRSMAFLRFLCINLAILNLLPIPVLDGGHILFAIAEIVTRRRPSPKFVDFVTTAFAFMLIGLMALLLVRDVIRIHGAESRRHAAVQAEQEP